MECKLELTSLLKQTCKHVSAGLMVIDLIKRKIVQMKSSCQLVQLATNRFEQDRLVLFINKVAFEVITRVSLSWLWLLDPNLVTFQCIVKYDIFSLPEREK